MMLRVMPPNEAAADLLTLRQAAEKLDCHPDTIRRAIREGRIASQKVRGKFGAEWRVSAAAVGDYIRANTPGHDMSDAVQGSLSPVLAGPISDLMRDMQALAEALHRAHRAQPTPEDLAAEAEAQHRRDQVVADIADRVSEHPWRRSSPPSAEPPGGSA